MKYLKEKNLKEFDLFRTQKCIFPKGLTHDFGQKFKFFQPLFFIKIFHKILFAYFLDRKEPFINYKKFNLFKSKKCTFPKGLTHDFG